MSVLTSPKFLPQQRVDLEDMQVFLESICSDWKFFVKQFWAPGPYIVKGFAVSGIGGASPATVAMTDATLINVDNSECFSWFTSDVGAPNIQVVLQAGARNYIEVELVNEDGTPLTKAFWDPSAQGGLGAEFNQNVNTVTNVKANIVALTGGFSGAQNRVPLAIVDTDGSNNIKLIIDKRKMLFRLGEPGDPQAEYSWGSQTEPELTLNLTGASGTFEVGEIVQIGSETAEVTTGGMGPNIGVILLSSDAIASGDTVTGLNSGATGTLNTASESFSGADKNIDNIRELFQSITTEIKALKKTRFWFEKAVGSIGGLSSFFNSVLVAGALNAKYAWDGSELSISDESVTPADADVMAYLRRFGIAGDIALTRQDGSGGSTTIPIGDGEVLFIKVPDSGNRTYSGVGTGDTEYQVVALEDFVPSDENYWLAYREGSLLYVRGYGELETGEETPITDPDKETILAMIEAAEARSNQDRNVKLAEGGTWSVVDNAGTLELTLSADAYAKIPGLTQDRNTIDAQVISFPNANSIAYISLLRTAGATSSRAVTVDDEDNVVLDDDILVIARRVSDGILVGNSFLLKPGEFLELDGALAEINRYFGQLRMVPHASNGQRLIITGADISKLSGSSLGQTLSNLLLKFDGAEIDISTGEIFESDGTTPLGIDFTPPTVAASQYRWLSVTVLPSGVNADNTIGGQIQVLIGDADGATPELATKAPFASGIQLGQFYIQRDAGDTAFEDLGYANIVQLGIGSGSGSGSGDASSLETIMTQRLLDSDFELLTPNIAKIHEDDRIDPSSTAQFSIVDQSFKFTNISDVLLSTQMLDPDEFLGQERDVAIVELLAFFKEGFDDPLATFEVSRDGGNEFQPITMSRVGENTTLFRGRLQFEDEAMNQLLQSHSLASDDADLVLNATTQQSVGQIFTVATDQVVKNVDIEINKTGSPTGYATLKLVRDNAGSPSTDLADVLVSADPIDISALSGGINSVAVSIPAVVLAPGDYHLVLETDSTYKSGFSTGVTEIAVRTEAAGTPVANVYNGTAWSAGTGQWVYEIEGRELILLVRVTGGTAGALLDAYGILYAQEPSGIVTGLFDSQVFTFQAVADNTREFNVTNFIPNPKLVKVYVRGTGQVFKHGDFEIDGQIIRFPANTFNNGGVEKTQVVQIEQVEGGAFDNSDTNATEIAEARQDIADIERARLNYAQNAEFRFFQRQSDPTVLTTRADDVYGPDRWYALVSGGTGVQFARTQEGSNNTSSRYACQLRQSDGTARQFGMAQILEADRIWALRGKEITLSFWARTDSTEVTAIRAGLVEWTGTADSVTSDIVSSWADTPTLIANAAFVNTPTDLPLTSSWQKFEFTVTLGVTFNNLAIFLWTPNTEAQNDDFYIKEVQLVAGGKSIPWTGVQLSTTDDLEDCQRYYWRIAPGTSRFYPFAGFLNEDTRGQYVAKNPVRMRIAPTGSSGGDFAHYTSTAFGNGADANITVTGVSFTGSSVDTLEIRADNADSNRSGMGSVLQDSGGASFIAADAEL